MVSFRKSGQVLEVFCEGVSECLLSSLCPALPPSSCSTPLGTVPSGGYLRLTPVPAPEAVAEPQCEPPLAGCRTRGMCVHPCYSPLGPPGPPLRPHVCAVHTSALSVSPLLPRTWVHWYCLSRFHICVLIYDICFSFSDLLHSVEEALGSSTLKLT